MALVTRTMCTQARIQLDIEPAIEGRPTFKFASVACWRHTRVRAGSPAMGHLQVLVLIAATIFLHSDVHMHTN